MNCEQITQLLAAYLQDNVDQDERLLVEQHIQKCPQCGEEVALWKNLAMLPEEQPSPALRSRFKSMLETYQEGRWEQASLAAERRKNPGWLSGNWLRGLAGGIAWACLFLIVGFYLGRNTSKPDSGHTQELAAMHSELTNMRQLVVLSLLQQESASQRLQAITWSTQAQQPDPQVLAALLHTLRYDSSVNVRLAALDALGRYQDQPAVRHGLVEALQPQQSPMVQLALIDLLVELRDATATQQLKKFEQEPKLNPTVREHVEWGIRQLT
jgi:hypothetical protein